jgi:hypothetical protein
MGPPPPQAEKSAELYYVNSPTSSNVTVPLFLNRGRFYSSQTEMQGVLFAHDLQPCFPQID